MFKKTISAPCPSIFDGSISFRGALTHKLNNKMVIVYYIFYDKFFSEFLNVQIYALVLNAKFRAVFVNMKSVGWLLDTPITSYILVIAS